MVGNYGRDLWARERKEESNGEDLRGESIRLGWRVTNIYRREGGSWKMVHHHTDVPLALVGSPRPLRSPTSPICDVKPCSGELQRTLTCHDVK